MAKKKLTKHHVLPRSRGGTNDPDNLVMVTNEKHEAYHLLFANAKPSEVISILFRDWGFGKYFSKGGRHG